MTILYFILGMFDRSQFPFTYLRLYMYPGRNKKMSGFDYHLHKMKFTISQIYARPISFVQCNVQAYNQTRLLAIKKCWCLVIPNEPQNNKLSTIITPITKKRSVFIFFYDIPRSAVIVLQFFSCQNIPQRITHIRCQTFVLFFLLFSFHSRFSFTTYATSKMHTR